MLFKDTKDGFKGFAGNITLECDFRTMHAVILRSGECEYYCSLKFKDSWEISNIIIVKDIGSQKELFRLDLIGDSYDGWCNQMKKAFDDFITENVKVDYYEIGGIKMMVVD